MVNAVIVDPTNGKGVWVRFNFGDENVYYVPNTGYFYTNDCGTPSVYSRVPGSENWSQEKKESFAAELRWAQSVTDPYYYGYGR